MENFLDKIIELKKTELKNIVLTKNYKTEHNSLIKIVNQSNKPVIISEIKKASPSKGIIRKNFNFNTILDIYLKSKYVNAISILTEKFFFKGELDFVKQASDISDKPILRKDFIIDEKQIYETAESGADLILLIAAILTEKQYSTFYNLSKKLGLEIITEVHNLKELNMVSKYNPEIIGVNNRNLKTFRVNLQTSEELIKHKKTDSIFISESGIKTSTDIKKLYNLGFKVFLIGETIMKKNNIDAALKNLFYFFNTNYEKN